MSWPLKVEAVLQYASEFYYILYEISILYARKNLATGQISFKTGFLHWIKSGLSFDDENFDFWCWPLELWQYPSEVNKP